MIRGYEKAWAALLAGGMVTAMTTLGMWLMSFTGTVPVPDELAIAGAITGFIAALFSAAGAYIATTSAPTEEDPNRNQVGVPMPTAPATTTP